MAQVSDRDTAAQLVGSLHAARVNGDLKAMCSLFSDDGHFVIRGASADKPIAINAAGLANFKPWLAMMVRVFRVSDYERLAMVIEWPRATVHWRATIYSKVTGVAVPTELVDLVEIRDGRIFSYNEFFVPR